jgi:phosphate/sulfate permease
MSGGWKIIKTMGTRITKVTSLEGVSAETAGAVIIFTDHLVFLFLQHIPLQVQSLVLD